MLHILYKHILCIYNINLQTAFKTRFLAQQKSIIVRDLNLKIFQRKHSKNISDTIQKSIYAHSYIINNLLSTKHLQIIHKTLKVYQTLKILIYSMKIYYNSIKIRINFCSFLNNIIFSYRNLSDRLLDMSSLVTPLALRRPNSNTITCIYTRKSVSWYL